MPSPPVHVAHPSPTTHTFTEAELDRICTPVTYRGVTYTREQLQKLADGRRILYLYSGPQRDMDAVALGQVMQADVHAVDVLRHDSHDMADQHLWDDVRQSFQSRWYDASLMSPPCGTFSGARQGPGGPPPLRGEFAPEIYGLRNLRPPDKEAVRCGTLHALRTAELAEIGSSSRSHGCSKHPA